MIYVLRYEANHYPEDAYTIGAYSSFKFAEEVRDNITAFYKSPHDKARMENYSIEVFDIEGEEE